MSDSGQAPDPKYLEELADYYRWYAAETFENYEPHYDSVCRTIADTPAVVELIGRHESSAHQPNVILAAVRYLLFDQPEHELARIYAGSAEGDVGPLFCDFVLSHRAQIDELMTHRRTQTNEIGRSAAIALGLAEAHRRSQQPLAWIDLGCSAGLNLLLDQLAISYHVDDTVRVTGNPGSLAIDCTLFGNPVHIGDHAPPIEWRVGIDRAPIHPSNAADAQWLRSCVFPSRAERSTRLAAALELAQQHPAELRQGDAAPGLKAALADAPEGLAVVITTTWVWYYLPLETRSQILDAMRQAARPVHWISIEGAGVVEGLPIGEPPPVDRAADGSAIGLWSSTGRADDPGHFEFLGWTHHHGMWVDWRATI